MNTRTRLDPELLSQLACHILVYADMLFSWELLNKRLELLGAVKTSSFIRTPPQNLDMRFGASHSCVLLGNANTHADIQPAYGQCGHGRLSDDDACSMCGNHQTSPRCSVCRLPVKGKCSMRSPRGRPLTDSVFRSGTELWSMFAYNSPQVLARSTV